MLACRANGLCQESGTVLSGVRCHVCVVYGAVAASVFLMYVCATAAKCFTIVVLLERDQTRSFLRKEMHSKLANDFLHISL